MEFVHAQVHATDEKVSWAIIQVAYPYRGLLCHDKWSGATYQNVLSIPIYDLSHWLPCEAHPKSSAKCVGTNLCTVVLGLSI